jgi:DivIVA domain-containing protein
MTVDPTSARPAGTGSPSAGQPDTGSPGTGPAAPSSEDAAALLRSARLATVKLFGQGYDFGEVDDYLDRLAREVGKPAGERDLELLRGIPEVRFTPRASGPRYTMDSVDDFLDQQAAPAIAAVLEREEGVARPAAPETATGAIAAELQAARFAPARRGDRYDMDGVDGLLERTVAALTGEGDEPTRAQAALQELLAGTPASAGGLREGYRGQDVDTVLGGVVERLRRI